MKNRPPLYVREARPVDTGCAGGCLHVFLCALIMGFVVALGAPPWLGLLLAIGLYVAR